MSAHTPGSWLRDGECVYALEKVRGRHGLGERNRVYFWIQGGPDTPKAEVIATAALAQAAPDLLAALEALLIDRHIHEAGPRDACRRCGTDIRSPHHFDAGESRKTDLARARAAIAKARGES